MPKLDMDEELEKVYNELKEKREEYESSVPNGSQLTGYHSSIWHAPYKIRYEFYSILNRYSQLKAKIKLR